MNPVASTKCAGRLLMALAAIASILLIASCGSGGSPARSNQVGFTDSDLKGTYVFSSAGSDANGNPLALAGAFATNGSGGITGGTMDVVDPAATTPVSVGLAITSGSYNVNTDGRGQATLTSSVGTFTLDFVLTSNSHGLVSEFDSNGTGSGTLDLQTAVTSLSQLAGPFAFSLAGNDSDGNPFATAGAFTLNASGTTTTPGVEDFNDAALFVDAGQSLTAAATLGSGTDPGTIALTTPASFGKLTFDFYPIDATHLKFIETDDTDFLSGDAFTQTGASIPTGPMVFTMAGGTESSGPIANGGLMTSTDGLGDFSRGLEDVNDSGTVPAQGQFSGTLDAEASGTVGGRVFVNLTGFAPAADWVIYPSSGGLLMLEMDTANITTGVGYAQTATSFAASEYGLNLSGANPNGEVDNIAQFDASSPTSSPNLTGILDENNIGSESPLLTGLSLSGTYTPDSPATGRGSIAVPSINTNNGTLNLEYYVVDASTVVFIDIDTTQVAAGTFELQSVPGGGGAVRSRVSVVHPVVRHAALRRK